MSVCGVCVRATGKDLNHNRDARDERDLSEYSFDYCFPGDELGFKWVVLVGKERRMGTWMASAIPDKGGMGHFGRDKCLEFINENGDGQRDVIVKVDQKNAAKYLEREIIEGRPEGRTIPEEAPRKSSGSNGIVERGVQEIEDQIRALLLGSSDRIGRRVDPSERIVAFIPDYAAYLVNRLLKGLDGKVGYERVKGKKPTILGVEFGEKVLFKRKLGSKMEKINARWDYGIFVGVRRMSNEVWVATQDGIFNVRAVRRIPVEKRWSEDCLTWIRWALWHRYKDDEGADGDVPDGVPLVDGVRDTGDKERTVYIDTRAKAPRDFHIRKEDAEKHGFTRGCAGCSSWFKGLARQPHTPECRNRFRDLMRDSVRLKNQEARKREFEQREEDKKKRKAEKKEERKQRDEVSNNGRPGSSGDVSGFPPLGGCGIKRKAEDDPEGIGPMEINQVVVDLVDKWIQEVKDQGFEEDGRLDWDAAWDDVNGGGLPLDKVLEARKEEVEYIVKKKIGISGQLRSAGIKRGKHQLP